jgi:hypothetical protein
VRLRFPEIPAVILPLLGPNLTSGAWELLFHVPSGMADGERSTASMTLTSPSKYRNPVLAGVVFALIVLGAVAAAVLWSGYVRDVEEAKTRADRLTRLLEEHTLRNIQAVDLVLQIVVDASPNELSDHDPEFEDWLRRRLKDLPHVRALFTIGPDGIITQHSDHPNEPRVTLADRNHLIHRGQ